VSETAITCDCSIDVGEPMSPHMVQIRTARKQHKCCECGEIIEPGQQYEFVSGATYGQWDTFKTCLTCRNIRDDYCPYGWYYGFLEEHLWECLGLNYITGEDIDDDGAATPEEEQAGCPATAQ